MRAALFALLWFAAGCNETVRVPLDIGTSDPSCAVGFDASCAESVRVTLTRPGLADDSECIALTTPLGSLADLPAAIASVTFSALEAGDVVTISIELYDASNCSGFIIASGTSAAATLADELAAIPVDLICEPATCDGGSIAFAARVHEIFGDGDGIETLPVTVGLSTTSYAQQQTLVFASDNRFTGQLSPGTGCVSAAITGTFSGMPYVSCAQATGEDSGDHFAFAASSVALREAFDTAGLNVARTILGRVETAEGAPVSGAAVTIENEAEVLYFDPDAGGSFAIGAGTLSNGIFAVRPLPAGCCESVSSQDATALVTILEDAVVAARLVVTD